MKKSADVSGDGCYRYTLDRVWDKGRPVVMWIMLNPSIADANQDDPTIRRCVAFAKFWGYGGISVRNLFAYRTTQPAALSALSVADAVGLENEIYLSTVGIDTRDLVVCAWGAHGELHNRGEITRNALRGMGITLHHLGLTKAGHPRHPLHLSALTRPEEWK